MGIILYRLIELIDGENKYNLIPYYIAERIKVFILTHLIKG